MKSLTHNVETDSLLAEGATRLERTSDSHSLQKGAQVLQTAIARRADAAFGNVKTSANLVIVGLLLIQKE